MSTQHNRIAKFLCVFSIVFFSFFFLYVNADEFLKFHWNFDEGTGTTANDASGNVTTYPGTLSGGPTWIPGGGLSFDGVNDYVRTNSPLPSSMGVSDQAYTLSASVRVGAGETDGNIIHISNGANGIGWCIAMLHLNAGKFRAIGWNNGEVLATSPTSATIGEWYSIANTWDPNTQELQLYVNGQLVASTTMAHYTAAGQSVYVFAGINASGCSNNRGWFKGDIKDVRIYNRAITQQEAVENTSESLGLTAVSFSPSDNSVDISPTSNLVINFSTTTVATSSGSIHIRKTSDDSLVESIAVTGSKITKSGSEITINPDAVLDEYTEYYISIPGTAFKDALDTFYDGTTASTTWSFTTSDTSVPVITNIGTSSVTTSVNVTWTTNEQSSTRLWYSVDLSYASSTSEADTSTRVTSHSASVSDLIRCTQYNYKVVSRDAYGNTATSTGAMFITSGCVGDISPTSATSTPILVNSSATSTLADSGRALSVITPANFTSTSSSVVIQIKGLTSSTVLNSIGKPSPSLTSAAEIVFDVKALINNVTELDSFDVPVTVSYVYTNEDIAGLDESTLSMYHYANNAWSELDACTVDIVTNTITCNAPHFSIFAIFGQVQSTTQTTQVNGGATAGGGTAFGCKDKNALNYEFFAQHKQELCQYDNETVVTQQQVVTLVRDLRIGMQGEDVLLLQRLLNTNGYLLASSGAGSPGQETKVFGTLTRNALAKYQSSHNVLPSIGYFGPVTRTKIRSMNLLGLWW